MNLDQILHNIFGSSVTELDNQGSRSYAVPGKYQQKVMDFLGGLVRRRSTPTEDYLNPLPTSTPTPTLTPTSIPTSTPTRSPSPTREAVAGSSVSTDYNDPYRHFGVNSGATPSAQIAPIIERSANENDLLAAILAAMLYQESTFRPDVIAGPTGNQDIGIAQINEKAHPDVTREQALNPEFAIPFMARKLRSDLDYFGGDYNRAIAAYNVGRGGASVKGDTPSGLGPLGQFYIDNVIRNLSDELKTELGLRALNP